MAQFALPLTIGGDLPERIVVGLSNQAAIEASARAHEWPFRTAILAGPPRSGKSLLARWFAESGLGEAIVRALLNAGYRVSTFSRTG